MACDPLHDPKGEKQDAPFHFMRIKKEFENSVHFTATKDKFIRQKDFMTGIHFIITKTENRFICSLCHHPHYMKTTAELGAPMAILKTQNKGRGRDGGYPPPLPRPNESETLKPCGSQAALFWPEPELPNDLPTRQRKPEAVTVNYWHEAMNAFKATMMEARHIPETARTLFALAAVGSRDDPDALA